MDHIAQALRRVYSQYRNSTKLLEWMKITATAANEIQTAADKVRLSYDIDSNSGEQLDNIGRVVGLAREFVGSIPLDVCQFDDEECEFGDVDAEFSGLNVNEDEDLSDDYYRVALRAKIAKNNSLATYDDIAAAFEFAFPSSAPVNIDDKEDMSLFVNVGGTLTAIEKNLILTKDIVPRPIGVRFLGFNEGGFTGRLAAPQVHLPLTDDLTGQLYGDVTFSRTDSATYVQNGVLLTAAANEPRFETESSLIEVASTNLIPDSDLSGFSLSDVSRTLNAGIAPDGTATATRLVDNANNSQSRVALANIPCPLGDSFCFSVYVKPDDNRKGVTLYLTEASSGGIITDFNLDAKTYSQAGIDGATNLASGIIDLENGWFRIWVAMKKTASVTQIDCNVYFSDNFNNGNAVYTGDGTSGILVFGAQCESLLYPTSYIPTSGSSESRDAAYSYSDAGLLAEGASTNEITHSSDIADASWSGNATISSESMTLPDGTTGSATKIEDPTDTASRHWSYVLNHGADNITRTGSLFIKKGNHQFCMVQVQRYGTTTTPYNVYVDFDNGAISDGVTGAQLKPMAGGWFRLEIPAPEGDAANIYTRLLIYPVALDMTTVGSTPTGYCYAWGAQIEALPFASSYIPTAGAADTRAADFCSLLFANNMNLDSWSVSFRVGGEVETGAFRVAFEAFGAATHIRLIHYASGDLNLLIKSGSSAASSQIVYPLGAPGSFYVAVAFDGNTYRMFVNGAEVASAQATVVCDAPPDTIRVGSAATSNHNYARSKDLRIYPFALTAAEVAELHGA